MASVTHIYETRLRLKARNQGRGRKRQIARDGSTPDRATFFGDTKKTEKK